MSKYVMSDVHGCYDKFMEMINKIDLKDTDELYILGDIFDRGEEPLKILDYIVGHKNITLIEGNHERMFVDAFESGDYSLWYLNGGHTTHNRIMEAGLDKEQQIYHYIRRLPLFKIVDKFILVHAGLSYPRGYENMSLENFLHHQNAEEMLWTRENIGSDDQFQDYTVICGHTPVQSINKNFDKIVKLGSTIYMDCGCVFKSIQGKLACLRLDDMEEFYV